MLLDYLIKEKNFLFRLNTSWRELGRTFVVAGLFLGLGVRE
jgi:hypothetical protein